MTRIAVITGYPLSETVIFNRISPLVRALSNEGFTVKCFTYSITDETNPTYDVQKFPSLHYKSQPGISRIFLEFLNVVAAKLYFMISNFIGLIRYDVVIVSIPSMLFLFFGTIRSKKSIYVLDVRDLTWEYLLSGKNSIFTATIRKLFLSAVKRYDIILCSNNSECMYFKNQGFNEKIVILYANGISKDKFDFIENNTFNKIGTNDLFYAGNLGKAQNLLQIVKAISCEPMQLKLVGSGIEKDSIRAYIQHHRVPNVVIGDFLNWQDLISELCGSKILLLSLGKNYTSAVPSKVYEYLSTGVPIILVGPKGACSNLMESFGNTEFVDIGKENWELRFISAAKRLYLLTNFEKNSVYEGNRHQIETSYLRENNARDIAKLISGLVAKF